MHSLSIQRYSTLFLVYYRCLIGQYNLLPKAVQTFSLHTFQVVSTTSVIKCHDTDVWLAPTARVPVA